jgi:glycosyltransferase involved in cell wall biosynthesis
MTRVLHLLWGDLALSYGGIESVASRLIVAMRPLGFDGRAAALPSMNPLFITENTHAADLTLLDFEASLRRLLVAEEIEIVHSHNIHRPHAAGLAEVLCSVLHDHGIRHVATIHDIAHDISTPEERFRVTRLLNSTLCVSTSSFNEHVLRTRFGVTPLKTISPGVPFTPHEPCVDPPSAFTICYPGRIIPGKGILEAVLYAGHLSVVLGTVALWLSNRSEHFYGKNAAYLNEVDRVAHFFPRLQVQYWSGNAVYPDLYHLGHCALCLPSLTEGFGLVPLESIACGRPVVMAPTGGLQWAQELPGVAVIRDRNALLITKALKDVLLNWDRWHREALKAREMLFPEHDIEHVARCYADIYMSPGACRPSQDGL